MLRSEIFIIIIIIKYFSAWRKVSFTLLFTLFTFHFYIDNKKIICYNIIIDIFRKDGKINDPL